MPEFVRVHHFTAPRCPAVTVPPPEVMLRHPPTQPFPLAYLKPEVALRLATGKTRVDRTDTLPVRMSTFHERGLFVAYRDGLIFLTDTLGGVLREVGADVRDATVGQLGFVAADLSLQSARPGLPERYSDGLDAGSDVADMAADALEQVFGERARRPDPLSIRIVSATLKRLAGKKALVMPYADLVEVFVTEERPATAWERLTRKKTPRCWLTFVFETAAGARQPYTVSMEADEAARTPFHVHSSEWGVIKLDWSEATALVFMHARAQSAIAAIAPVVVEAGATGAGLAAAVLHHLGAAGEALEQLPYARHGMTNPVADLRVRAEAG